MHLQQLAQSCPEVLTFVKRLFWVFVAYRFKHYIADFLLQGRYMLGKFGSGVSWILPLAAHCGVHLAFTLAFAWLFAPIGGGSALVDFAVHFVVDRIKADPKLGGLYQNLSKKEMAQVLEAEGYIKRTKQYAPSPDGGRWTMANVQAMLRSNKLYYWALGLDQEMHSLTHYAIIWFLVQ